MSWRRFQTLTRGLIGREGSKWWVALTADFEGDSRVWKPGDAGDTTNQERAVLAAFGIKKPAREPNKEGTADE